MEPDTRLPGLTFHLEKAELGKSTGILHLRATVNDNAVWDSVVSRIDGYRVHAQEGLTQEAISLLQGDVQERDSALTQAQQRHHAELEQLRQQYHQAVASAQGWQTEAARQQQIAQAWKARADSWEAKALEYQRQLAASGQPYQSGG